MAHITGGGITENLPRTLPEGASFSLDRESWTVPPLFRWLQRAGGIDDAEMFRAFNMGVGLVIIVCARRRRRRDLASLRAAGEPAPGVVGTVVIGGRTCFPQIRRVSGTGLAAVPRDLSAAR